MSKRFVTMALTAMVFGFVMGGDLLAWNIPDAYLQPMLAIAPDGYMATEGDDEDSGTFDVEGTTVQWYAIVYHKEGQPDIYDIGFGLINTGDPDLDGFAEAELVQN